MPPSSRMTIRLFAARDGVQTNGKAIPAAPASAVLITVRRPGC
jgi:hypothetical protein